MFLNIRIMKVPGINKELSVYAGTTVGQALQLAEIRQDNSQIQVNGRQATAATVLQDRDTVLLTAPVKGA